jgi:hypothetical protein
MRLQKGESGAIEGTGGEAGADTRPRREGRGWGPFSGGQLTTIVVTFAVLLLLPVGAWAVSFSNVAITDPGGVNQAKVDGGKNLHAAVADPAGVNVAKVDAKNNLYTATRDAVSGVAARVDAFGRQLAAVSGSVTATPAAASEYFHKHAGVNGTFGAIATPPTGKALIVTSLQVDWFFADFANDPYVIFQVSDPTCATPVEGGADFFEIDLPDKNDHRTIPITPGWPIPAGKALCAVVGGNAQVSILTFGYLVPSTSVPPLPNAVKGSSPTSPRTRR